MLRRAACPGSGNCSASRTVCTVVGDCPIIHSLYRRADLKTNAAPSACLDVEFHCDDLPAPANALTRAGIWTSSLLIRCVACAVVCVRGSSDHGKLATGKWGGVAILPDVTLGRSVDCRRGSSQSLCDRNGHAKDGRSKSPIEIVWGPAHAASGAPAAGYGDHQESWIGQWRMQTGAAKLCSFGELLGL